MEMHDHIRHSGQETNDRHQVSVKNWPRFARIYPWDSWVAQSLEIFTKSSGQIWLCISNTRSCGQGLQQMGPSFNGVQWPWPNGHYLLLPAFLPNFCLHLATNFRSINIATFNACFMFIQSMFCLFSTRMGQHVCELKTC